MPSQARWKPAQYERSPCNGLGTAGNVCPAVLLPCRVQSTHWNPEAAEAEECLVQPLHDFGYNGVVNPAPTGMLRALRQSYPTLRYIGVERYEANNRPVNCKNPHIRPMTLPHAYSSSNALLLDRNLRVLAREHITGGGCVSGRWRVNDARLALANRTLWLIYYNAWGSTPADAGGLPCKGYWMSRLHLHLNARGKGSEKSALHATLQSTERAGGVRRCRLPAVPRTQRTSSILRRSAGWDRW